MLGNFPYFLLHLPLILKLTRFGHVDGHALQSQELCENTRGVCFDLLKEMRMEPVLGQPWFITACKSSRLCSQELTEKSLSIHPIQQLFLDASLL